MPSGFIIGSGRIAPGAASKMQNPYEPARTLNDPIPSRFHPNFDDREIQLLAGRSRGRRSGRRFPWCSKALGAWGCSRSAAPPPQGAELADHRRIRWEFKPSPRPVAPINKTHLTLRSALRRPAAGQPKAPPNPTTRKSAVESPDSRGRIGNRSSESLSSGLRGRSSRRGCSETEA